MTLLQNARRIWSPPFEKGGLGGILICHTQVEQVPSDVSEPG